MLDLGVRLRTSVSDFRQRILDFGHTTSDLGFFTLDFEYTSNFGHPISDMQFSDGLRTSDIFCTSDFGLRFLNLDVGLLQIVYFTVR